MPDPVTHRIRKNIMDRNVAIVTISLAVLVPLISIAYVGLRLRFRIDQLRNFFSLPGIRKAYLTSKGESIENKSEDCLKERFREIFNRQVSREYGVPRFLVGIFMGSIFAALAIFILGPVLTAVLTGVGDTDLRPIHFALLGAYVWTLWVLLSGFESLNLTPLSFFWIPFRFVVALVAGTLAPILFKENSGTAAAFVMVVSALPYPELIAYPRLA